MLASGKHPGEAWVGMRTAARGEPGASLGERKSVGAGMCQARGVCWCRPGGHTRELCMVSRGHS